MADLDAYPTTFKQLLGSIREPFDDVVIDRAVNGAGKARGFYTGRKHRFTLKHALSVAEYSTLQTLYDANRLLRVTLTWQGPEGGSPYVCFFDGPLGKPTYATPTLLLIDVKLVQQ